MGVRPHSTLQLRPDLFQLDLHASLASAAVGRAARLVGAEGGLHGRKSSAWGWAGGEARAHVVELEGFKEDVGLGDAVVLHGGAERIHVGDRLHDAAGDARRQGDVLTAAHEVRQVMQLPDARIADVLQHPHLQTPRPHRRHGERLQQ